MVWPVTLNVLLCYVTLHSNSNLGRQHTNAPPAATIGPFCEVNVTLDFVISEVITNVHVHHLVFFIFFFY